MTLRRDPLSIDAALMQAMQQLSPEEVRAATGKKPHHFHVVSQPNNNLGLWFSDAAALDAALLAKGEPPIFKPIFKSERDRVMTRIGDRPPHRPEDVRRRALAIGAVIGDLNRVVHGLGERDHDGIAEVLHEDIALLVEIRRQADDLFDLLLKDAEHARAADHVRREAPDGSVHQLPPARPRRA
jgi:hypothetical protein